MGASNGKCKGKNSYVDLATHIVRSVHESTEFLNLSQYNYSFSSSGVIFL